MALNAREAFHIHLYETLEDAKASDGYKHGWNIRSTKNLTGQYVG